MAQTLLYRIALPLGNGFRYFRGRAGSALSVLSQSRNVSLQGDTEITMAEYAAGLLTCDGTGEIDTPVVTPPVTPVATIDNLTHSWDSRATSYRFQGYFRVSDNAEYVAYMEPLDGQAVPANFYIDTGNTSATVNGVAVNRTFIHGSRSEGFFGLLPGRYIMRTQGKYDTRPVASIPVTLVAQASQVINEVYVTVQPGAGRVALANVTGPVEVQLTGRLTDGTVYSGTWQNAALLSGEQYGAGGATVQYVYGTIGTAAGDWTYSWRSVGSTDPATYVRISYTVGGATETYTVVQHWAQRAISGGTDLPTSVTGVEYIFVTNNQAQGNPNVLTVFVKIDNPATIQMATEVTGPPGLTLPKSGYTTLNSGDYGNGYTRAIANSGVSNTSVVKLYFRRIGTTTDLFSLTLPALPASGNISRTNVYTA